MEEYPTPIQTLHDLKGKEVTVELRNKDVIKGKLIAFDLYTNITLETEDGTRFIQGGSVNFVFDKETKKEDKEETTEEKEEDHSPEDTTA